MSQLETAASDPVSGVSLQPRRNHLARFEVALVMGGQFLQLAMTFGTSMLIARMLNADGYGVVNLLRTLIGTFVMVAPLGLDVALLKYCGRSSADDPVVLRTIEKLRRLVAGVSVALILVGVLAASTPLLHTVYPYKDFERMLVVNLLALPFAADIAMLGAVYRARRQASHFALMTQYLQSTSRVVMVLLAFVYARTLLAVVCINTLQVVISSVVIFWHHYSGSPRGPGAARSAVLDRKAWGDARLLLGESGWMCMSIFVYGLMRVVDIMFLGAYGDARSLGEYAAVSTVSQLIQFFPLAASQSLGPEVSAFYHRGEKENVRKRLLEYVRQASVVSGFMFGGIAIFGQNLDLVFGKSFHFQPWVCLLLPLGQVLSATLAPTGFALSMTGHHRQENMILCLGCAVLVGLCAVLIPRYGQVGAAGAVALSFLFVNAVRYVYVAKILNFVPGTLQDFLPPLVALALAWGAKQVGDALGSHDLLTTFLSCVLYTLVFAAVSFALFLPPGTKAMLRRRFARLAIIR